MYCTTKTLMYILCIFNFFCALLGILLIWFGLWLLHSIIDVKIDQGENLAAILTTVLGSVVFLTAVFGCMAIYLESKSMLISYAVILVILLVIQIILVSISYTSANEGVSEGLKQGFDELFDKADHPNSTLNHYEEWLQCCGKNSAEDYFLLDKIPSPSCCKQRDCTNVLNLYVVGCEQKFKAYVRSKTSNFNTLSWFIIIAEFIGSVLACVLIDSLRNHRDRIRFYS